MKEAREILVYGAASLLFVAAGITAIWGVGFIVSNIGAWWKDVTYIAPPTDEEKAQKAKESEEWKTNPRNPDFIYGKCLSDGGFPGNDGWGNIQCHFKGDER